MALLDRRLFRLAETGLDVAVPVALILALVNLLFPSQTFYLDLLPLEAGRAIQTAPLQIYALLLSVKIFRLAAETPTRGARLYVLLAAAQLGMVVSFMVAFQSRIDAFVLTIPLAMVWLGFSMADRLVAMPWRPAIAGLAMPLAHVVGLTLAFGVAIVNGVSIPVVDPIMRKQLDQLAEHPVMAQNAVNDPCYRPYVETWQTVYAVVARAGETFDQLCADRGLINTALRNPALLGLAATQGGSVTVGDLLTIRATETQVCYDTETLRVCVLAK